MVFTLSLFILGLWTGVAATAVMTIFMMIGMKTGMAPMNLPLVLGQQMLGKVAQEKTAKMIGLVIHFMIGTILGIVYQLLVANRIIFIGFSFTSALLFAIFPWLIMMVLLMPMMGMGLFGMKKGARVPMMTFLLHMLYGGALAYFVSL